MISQPAFLSRMVPETASAVQQFGIRRNWPRRATIFRTGEPCAGIHIVIDGLVKLYRSNRDGKEQILFLEGPGGVLTTVPILDEGNHLASADTLKPTTTLFVSQEDVLRLCQERNDLRELLLAEITRRFRLAIGLLETISLKSISARVATRVLEVASANDALDGSRSFDLLLSQDELSHVLATSRESVARALAELRAAGVLEQHGSKIRILDAQQLVQCSQTRHPGNATPLPSRITTPH